MIAIDSNVLLRYLLADDPAQTAQAIRCIEENDSILITDVVLVETLWTLKGKKYRLSKDRILKIINKLFQEPRIRFENSSVIWRALHDYRQAETINIKGQKKTVDFSDALIVNKARWLAQQSNQPFEGAYTFDRAAQQINGMLQPS